MKSWPRLALISTDNWAYASIFKLNLLFKCYYNNIFMHFFWVFFSNFSAGKLNADPCESGSTALFQSWQSHEFSLYGSVFCGLWQDWKSICDLSPTPDIPGPYMTTIWRVSPMEPLTVSNISRHCKLSLLFIENICKISGKVFKTIF